jgi:mRNA interferase RelE/StbE
MARGVPLAYRVEVRRSAEKEIASIGDAATRQRVLDGIESLKAEGRPYGSEKLSGRGDEYKLREGNFRIIYTIDDEANLVVVSAVLNRREAYR